MKYDKLPNGTVIYHQYAKRVLQKTVCMCCNKPVGANYIPGKIAIVKICYECSYEYNVNIKTYYMNEQK